MLFASGVAFVFVFSSFAALIVVVAPGMNGPLFGHAARVVGWAGGLSTVLAAAWALFTVRVAGALYRAHLRQLQIDRSQRLNSAERSVPPRSMPPGSTAGDFRSRVSGERRPSREILPPSYAAVRDALAAPRRLGQGLSVAFGGVVVVDLVTVRDVPLLRQLGVLALLTSAFAFAIHAAVHLSRRALWTWLRHVEPVHVARVQRRRRARELALAMCLPTFITAMGAAGLVLLSVSLSQANLDGVRDAASPKAWVIVSFAGLLVLAATTISFVISVHIAGRFQRDTETVTRRIVDLQHSEDDVRVSSEPLPLLTSLGARLAEALADLSNAFVRVAERESKAREEIEEVQRLKTQFMARMSHELRSPLNSILGFSRVLAQGMDGPLSPSQTESVDLIQQSGQDLLRIVDDIVDSARLEAGKLQLHRAWTPTVEIITNAVEQLQSRLASRNLKLSVELEPGLSATFVDRERLVQSLAGLMVHVCPSVDGAALCIRGRTAAGPPGPDSHIRIEMIDPAAPSRIAHYERVSEVFAMELPTPEAGAGSFALSVSLARALVTAHGGAVWFEGHGAEGATLSMALPTDGPSRRPPLRLRVAPSGSSRGSSAG